MSTSTDARAEFAPGTKNPATLAPLDPVVWSTDADVSAAVARVRTAQGPWGRLPLAERESRVIALGQAILTRRAEIAEILWQETGRSPLESFMSDAAIAGGYTKRAARLARQALAPEKVKLSPLEFPKKRAVITAVPRGVIGVIAPWNYPLGNFMKSCIPALLAGNGIVMKPSEHSPRSGAWLSKLINELCGREITAVVQGDGRVGAALIAANIDSIVFTGSVPSGRKVAVAAAQKLIPCSVELGGKDAAIVLADCDFDRTVLGIAQWGLHNAGQNCAAIERVYVEQSIADRFVDTLGRVVSKLRVATGPADGDSDLGPLQNPAQLALVERQVSAAVADGARLVCGGVRAGTGWGYAPTVLDHCTDAMAVVTDETFGPVIAVLRVASADEAIARANASPYGLNGSIWTRDLARGAELAARLEVGVAYVNNHALGGTMPEIPWTGVRETGFGIAQSRHAYGSYVRRQTIFIDANSDPDPYWMPFDQALRPFADALAEMQLGSVMASLRLLGLLKNRVRTLKAFVASEKR